MSASGIPFPHSIPNCLAEQPLHSHGGIGTHRDRVKAPAAAQWLRLSLEEARKKTKITNPKFSSI